MCDTPSPSVAPLRSVAIIGGGLGGLALAQHIRRLHPHLRATVYERDQSPHARRQGYFIGLNANGVSALRPLCESLAPLEQLLSYEPAMLESAVILTGALRKLLWMSVIGKSSMVVSRGALRHSLLDGIDIQWNKRLRSFTELDDCVRIEFEDGTEVEADFLVGADGARSRVRLARWPELSGNTLDLSFCGGSAMLSHAAATCPQLSRLTHRSLVVCLGERGHTIVGFGAQDSLTWTLCWPKECDTERRVRAIEHGNLEQLHAVALECGRANFASPEIAAMIAHTQPADMIDTMAAHAMRPRATNPFGERVTRVTLLGDSLHTMSMHRGLGANTAFVDAVRLAEALGERDWRAAIGVYQNDAHLRANKALGDSTGSAERMHLQGYKATLRNAMFWMIGWFLLVAGYWNIVRHTLVSALVAPRHTTVAAKTRD